MKVARIPVEDDLWLWFRVYAAQTQKTMQEVAREALQEYRQSRTPRGPSPKPEEELKLP